MFRRSVVASVVAVLAGLALVTEFSHSPFAQSGEVQQVTVTSTRGIVVIAIPGFPIESILVGLLLGGCAPLIPTHTRTAVQIRVLAPLDAHTQKVIPKNVY